MTTPWTLPTIITQYAEPGAEAEHVAWNDIDNFSALKNLHSSVQTVGNLIHTARSPKLDIKNKTYYLQASGFIFQNIPLTLSGISMRLTARRYGRATDDTIQLCLNNQPIGDNRAGLLIAPQIVYGGTIDLWNSNITLTDVQDPSFGVIIRFQAHKDWPHKDPVLINAIEMCLY